MAATVKTTSTVTISTLSSWNSVQAELYHRGVKPAGNQVPSKRVANELTPTAAIRATTLKKKKPIASHTSPLPEILAACWAAEIANPVLIFFVAKVLGRLTFGPRRLSRGKIKGDLPEPAPPREVARLP